MPAEVYLAFAMHYGHPMKPFTEIFGAWADKFSGIWGIFGQPICTHSGTASPLSMFSIIQPFFLQKTKPLYPVSTSQIFIWAAKN